MSTVDHYTTFPFDLFIFSIYLSDYYESIIDNPIIIFLSSIPSVIQDIVPRNYVLIKESQ